MERKIERKEVPFKMPKKEYEAVAEYAKNQGISVSDALRRGAGLLIFFDERKADNVLSEDKATLEIADIELPIEKTDEGAEWVRCKLEMPKKEYDNMAKHARDSGMTEESVLRRGAIQLLFIEDLRSRSTILIEDAISKDIREVGFPY